nr:hypothetical protein [Tanacetum cinerariifolium]
MPRGGVKQHPCAFPAHELGLNSLENVFIPNGSSCVDGSGAGLILTSPYGIEFTYALRFQFTASNNEAEYEALVAGLWIAARMAVQNVKVSVDSKLVANQVLGTYVAKQDNMVKYLKIVKSLVSGFTNLLNKPSAAKQKQKSRRPEQNCVNQLRALIQTGGVLPGDKKEDKKLRLKARQYELMEGVLYRRSFLTLWLRCVRPLQMEYVMREIHEGSCSMHSGPQSVVAKAIRLGHPQQPLTPITAPWPFYKWGIDIACPFPEGPGKVNFLIVAMDYFTKWIEAKAVAKITGGQKRSLELDFDEIALSALGLDILLIPLNETLKIWQNRSLYLQFWLLTC